MITKHQAMTCHEFFHVSLKNRDKKQTALRCRANGKCKTWKTRPNDFRLPVKYGLRECFYITPHNAAEWTAYDPNDTAEICAKLGLSPDVPRGILEDAMGDAGMLP